MGHTVQSQRQVLDLLMKELEHYGKALYKEDREVFEHVLAYPLTKIGSISSASSFHVWAFLLLSIIIEQEKKIQQLEEHHARLAYGHLPKQQQTCVVAQDTL